MQDLRVCAHSKRNVCDVSLINMISLDDPTTAASQNRSENMHMKVQAKMKTKTSLLNRFPNQWQLELSKSVETNRQEASKMLTITCNLMSYILEMVHQVEV